MSAALVRDEPFTALDGARDAVARGHRVIPVHRSPAPGRCACGDRCEPGSRGKHPIGPRWRDRASADPAQLDQWARQHPQCNWGGATGQASDLWVVDLDLGDDGDPLGEQTWTALFGLLPDTRIVQTGSGAKQLHFRYPRRSRADGKPWANTAKVIGPGIDTRGEGGQVVLPGSVSGKGPYVLLADRPLLDAPDAVLDHIEAVERERFAQKRGAQGARPTGLPGSAPVLTVVGGGAFTPGWVTAAVAGVVRDLEAVQPGQGRNTALNGAAYRLGRLVGAGVLAEDEARSALEAACDVNGYTAKDGTGARDATIRSGLESGIARPADPPAPREPGMSDDDREIARVLDGGDPDEVAALESALGVADVAAWRARHRPTDEATRLADRRPATDAAAPAMAGGDRFDPHRPVLDDARAAVIAPWAAVQVARAVAGIRAGRSTPGTVAAAERGQQAPALALRAWSLGGIAHYPAAGLDRSAVIGRLVDAALARGDEVAALGADTLRAVANTAWSAGVAEPMLPLDPDDERVPRRGSGKRACLPSAEEMAKVALAAETGDDEPPVAALVAFADQQWTFGNDGAGWLYAVPRTGPRTVGPVGERSPFRRRLTARAFDELGRTFRGEAYSQALDILRTRAEQAPAAPLHLRVAPWRDGTGRAGIVLDLGTPDARVVEVTGDGWRVVDAGPVHPYFRVPVESRPLPEPTRGGSLTPLADLLGVASDSRLFRVVVGWLVTALLHPEDDVPTLWWTGPQGAGKTTRSALVTSVLDPRSTRAGRPGKGGQLGRSTEDILVAAAARFIVTYDNLTTISTRQSDVLCGLVTGTSNEGRERFTDDQAAVIDVQRAMSITGRRLPLGVGTDLLDRLAVLDLERMGGADRRTSAALWAAFAEHHPAILGALLDLAVAVLTHRPAVEAQGAPLPRMSTHGLVLRTLDRITADQPDGGGYFHAYVTTVRLAKGQRASGDPLIAAVLDLLERHGRTWTGTAGDLLDALARPADRDVPWPGNGRVLSQRLAESPDVLTAAGIRVRQVKSGSVRRLELTAADPDDSPTDGGEPA